MIKIKLQLEKVNNMDSKQKIIYTKNCLEFLDYKCVTPNDKDFRIYEGKNSFIPSKVDANFNDGFLNNWNWIMEVVEAIEEKSSYTVMGRKILGEFEISRYNVKFFFTPNQNFLLHLELRPYIYEDTWKHPMFKNHIIKAFDFKKEGKKAAVVQAINQFLIWYENNK